MQWQFKGNDNEHLLQFRLRLRIIVMLSVRVEIELVAVNKRSSAERMEYPQNVVKEGMVIEKLEMFKLLKWVLKGFLMRRWLEL